MDHAAATTIGGRLSQDDSRKRAKKHVWILKQTYGWMVQKSQGQPPGKYTNPVSNGISATYQPQLVRENRISGCHQQY